MKHSPNLSLAASFLLFLSAVSGLHAETFNLTQVAPGLYVHQGQHLGIDHQHRDDIANIGFIVGTDCIAVIDTGGSLKTGQALLRAIRGVSDKPVCYVINTHIHYDHVLGNQAFEAERPIFVGHRALAEAMAANRNYFLRQFAAELGENASTASLVGPALLVDQSLEIDLGQRKLQLVAHPAAHTGQDLTVLDLSTNTLWLADLLFMDRVPSLDGSLRGWLKLLESYGQRRFARVIPGHGPVTASWPAAAKPEQRYLVTLQDEVRAAIGRGDFLEQALETVGRGERGRWQLFDQYHRRNISRAFAELEWE